MPAITLGLVVAAAAVAADTAPFTGIQKTALMRRTDQGINTFRIPGLTTTKTGTVLAVFDLRHANSRDLPGDIDVGLLRSTNSGQSWGPLQTILDFDKEAKGTAGNGVGDPCILADLQTGTVWVAGLWSKGNRAWRGSGPGLSPEQTGQFVLTRSDDDGRTWSSPINITTQVKKPEWHLCYQGPGRGIQLRDGALVMPAQYMDPQEVPHSFFIYSTDHGQTWKPSPPAVTGTNLQTTEAQIAELPTGELLLSMRNHAASKQRAWSSYKRGPDGDLGGGQWSPVRFAVADPTCMASLISYSAPRAGSNQDLLIFANPASATKRERLTIYLSRDGGQTWPISRLLDPRPCGYSCLTQLADGTIGILYETGDRSYIETLTFARFTIDWLMGPSSP